MLVRGPNAEVDYLSVCPRVRKLKETLAAVQQLDKNMSNLRSWLSGVEAELSRPITYSVCHHQEIQRRLAEQQVGGERPHPHPFPRILPVHLFSSTHVCPSV